MDAATDNPITVPQKSVVAICGPTGTGKSELAVHLARRFGGEVVSADSMQVYRGLDIGTAKWTTVQQEGIRHHLVDICDPSEIFSVADYVKAANLCIADILSRGKLPIVAGGTGLYVTRLLEGSSFLPEKPDFARRAALREQAEENGEMALWESLKAQDPGAAALLHPHQTQRIIRALELYEETGETMADRQAHSANRPTPWKSLCLCLSCKERTKLYSRLDARVEWMLRGGLLDEARMVWQNRETYKTAVQAIGYKEFFPYFEGTASVESCTAALKLATRHYAKRQLTWFRHHGNPIWLYIEDGDVERRAADLVASFLQGNDNC